MPQPRYVIALRQCRSVESHPLKSIRNIRNSVEPALVARHRLHRHPARWCRARDCHSHSQFATLLPAVRLRLDECPIHAVASAPNHFKTVAVASECSSLLVHEIMLILSTDPFLVRQVFQRLPGRFLNSNLLPPRAPHVCKVTVIPAPYHMAYLDKFQLGNTPASNSHLN
eukprot:COSAG05_NODE_717_length_7798_cov_5.545915_3_plen_170_part_00